MQGKYHTVLTRHLQKYWQNEPIPPKLEALLQAINQSFSYYDRDHELLDRAMELSSHELTEAYERIRKELEQKQVVHEKVIESEQLLQSITTNLSEAVFRREVNGNLVFVNEAFLELFGYSSKDDILKVPKEDFYINPDDRLGLVNQPDNKPVKGVEILFKRKDGSRFWGLASATLNVDSHGNGYIDGAIVDITGLKKTEEILRNTNDKLQKTNEELDRFVYSASHDLRAPLMSLLGLINIMEMEKVKGNLEYLDLMKKSIIKLDQFIKDIIDYSYNARAALSPEQVDFRELLDGAFQQFEYIDTSGSISKTLELDTKEVFFCDVKRLKVIFNNLISNSLRYHNLLQERPFIKISVRTLAESCQIEVTDNGIGIDPMHQDKIFQMFYRATTDNTGSGLGLYIVKEAVNKLGGTISLKSAVGKGTTFSIALPNSQVSDFS